MQEALCMGNIQLDEYTLFRSNKGFVGVMIQLQVCNAEMCVGLRNWFAGRVEATKCMH
jgi:hypothetical protein